MWAEGRVLEAGNGKVLEEMKEAKKRSNATRSTSTEVVELISGGKHWRIWRRGGERLTL
jgi:hypothetical protein